MRVLGTSGRNGLAMVLGMAMALVATDAMSQSYGSWGSSGSYGSYGSSASYGSYGSGGSYGSHGRMGLFARIHARRAARHASHGSYGSYASYGSSGSSGSYGGYSYGSAGSSGSYAYGGSAGSTSYSASYAPEETVASTGNASIKVSLPADAKVFVNEAETTSTGAERSYVSHGLRAGLSYTYAIRVEYEKDGQPVTEDKVVQLTAGKSVSLKFGEEQVEDATAAAEDAVKTQVKVQVPAEAKVFLSGAATKQSGESRTFTTTQLGPGQQWENYTVRVELDRDGETLVREKTLTVTGGDSYELAFDFDAAAGTPQLAQMVR